MRGGGVGVGRNREGRGKGTGLTASSEGPRPGGQRRRGGLPGMAGPGPAIPFPPPQHRASGVPRAASRIPHSRKAQGATPPPADSPPPPLP